MVMACSRLRRPIGHVPGLHPLRQLSVVHLPENVQPHILKNQHIKNIINTQQLLEHRETQQIMNVLINNILLAFL